MFTPSWGSTGDCPRHKRCVGRALPEPAGSTHPVRDGRPSSLVLSAVEELERCLADPLFRGVKFPPPWLQGVRACSGMVKETMVAILALPPEFDVPVLFHDGTPPYSTTYQIADVARWVPEGQGRPRPRRFGGLHRIRPRSSSATSRTSTAASAARAPGDLVHLVETAGADKILFGSDFGAGGGWELLPERVDNVTEAGLNSVDLAKILHANSERLS